MCSSVIRIECDDPIVDGSVADVFSDGQYVGTMLYSQDLDQWNDTEFPGEISDEIKEECASRMIEFRR